MVNKFPVRSCCYCKEPVEAGAGSVWKWNGRWYGKHAGCKKGGATNVVDLAERAAARTAADADAAAERMERESEDFMERTTARVAF